jgi:hypothetical protein
MEKPLKNCAFCGKPFRDKRLDRPGRFCSKACSSKGTASERGVAISAFYRTHPEKKASKNRALSRSKKARIERDPEYAARLRSIGDRYRGRCLSPAAVEKRLRTINQRYSKEQQNSWSSAGGLESGRRGVWNKGLTKQTDSRVAAQAQSFLGHTPNPGSGTGRSGFRSDVGFYVRSTWEADVVRVFRYLGLPFAYEPERFFLDSPDGCISYLPDFYLPSVALWVEVSGWVSPQKRLKVQLFQDQCSETFFHVDPSVYAGLASVFSPALPGWEGKARGTGDATVFLNLLSED